MAKPLLSINNLTIKAGAQALVSGVSLNVEPGQTVCVVGESGSGKTLTALAAIGLLPEQLQVTGGEIVFDGQNLAKLTHEQRRKLRGAQISMIFQEPMTSLNPVFTVGEQVAEVFRIHTKLSAAKIKAKVIELFNKVQIDNPEQRYRAYPHQLSGGQRQRVMIAMALAMQPKLLIADEPTTALDVTVQHEILKLIKGLQQEFKMSVLFITHDFGVVKQMADHVVVMQNGKLVETGTIKQVMTKPEHKYTQKLLAAMPTLDTKKRAASKENIFLEVRDLSKIFKVKSGGMFSKSRDFMALNKVSLTMRQGEVLGVVGESGCGKSTLSRCLVKLYEADGGEITFLGENIGKAKGAKLKAARRNMQMVFQDPFSSLNPRMKIGESVGEGLRAHNIMNSKARREYVEQLLADCGLPKDSYDRYPHQFSGGQRQRVCIARALALKPALIIADEAVSALDVSVQKEILELMVKLKKKHNISYLFVSHDLRVVSQICDRVLVMKNGEIVEEGLTHQIFTAPKQKYTKELLAAIPK